MRRLPLTLLATCAWLGVAAAEPTDHVLRSYWDADHRTIYSDVLRVGPTGLVQLGTVVGGTVDGIAMVQIPLYPEGAKPYVPTVGQMGARLRWLNSCIFVTPDSAGAKDIDSDAEIAALGAALDEWNTKTDACSYMKLMLEPSEPLEVGLDGKNTLKFREESWCRPASDRKPAECYDHLASAITTLCYINDASRPDNGAVLDADVEVNAVDYAIATGCETRCETRGNGTIADLQNTLTHEYGHVLGLDHTCWGGDPSDAPLDDQGQPAPSCDPESALPPDVTQATMYNFQNPRETEKRTVEADDVAGVCSAYPKADDPRLCEPTDVTPSSGCCAVAGSRGGRAGGAAGAGLLAAALLLFGRRLRRR